MNKEFSIIEENLRGYIMSVALGFEHNGNPYSKEDFAQEARFAIWETIGGTVNPLSKKDSFWKKVIRNRMINFYKKNVKKVNRSQNSYKEQFSRFTV